MENIVRISAIAVAAALCAIPLKKQVPEIGTVLGLVAGVFILLLSYPVMKSILRMMESFSETANLASAILAPVIKTVGIAIVTKLSAELCRDAKEGGIASFLESAGAVLALGVCIPLLEAVLSLVGEIL